MHYTTRNLIETARWLVVAIVCFAIVATGIYLIGKASYDTTQQHNQYQLDCAKAGGHMVYVHDGDDDDQQLVCNRP